MPRGSSDEVDPAGVQSSSAAPSHDISATGGAAPAVAAGANNGTSPPAPTITGNDARGTVSFGSGTTPAAGAQVVVTFNQPYTSTPTVVCSINDVASEALGDVGAISVTTTGFTIACATAPAGSQSAGTYTVSYEVLQ